MNRILVPLDGSERAETALPLAERLAGALEAEIVLVAVAELPETSDQALAAEAGEASYLDRASERLSRPARYHVEHAGAPARGITEAIEAEDPLLVVMATGDKSTVKSLIEGSVTEELLESSRVPLLLVPPTAQERSG